MPEEDILDAGVRGYIVNTARKNYWKVKSWYELDDLIQDGYLCAAKCWARFQSVSGEATPTPDDRRMFQAFVEAAFRNHITDLAQHPRSRQKELVEADFGDEAPLESWAQGAADLGDASLAALLARAPAEILEILKLTVVDGVADVPYLATKLRKEVLPESTNPRIVKGRHLVRETTAEHYDRCLGRVGVVAQLRKYLLQTE